MARSPDYERNGIRLYCGDALKLSGELIEGEIDLIVTDPPYGDTSLEWDKVFRQWPGMFLPTLAPHGSVWCFGSLRMFVEHAKDWQEFKLAQDLIWEKHNGSSSAADRFRRVHEHVAHFYPIRRQWADIYKHPVFTDDAVARTVRRKKRPPHWGDIGESSYESQDGGPRLMRSVMCCKSMHGKAVHPTQKPVETIEPLLEYSSAPGALVLDPFIGSGTTAVACVLSGRRCIGFERDRKHFESAVRRIDEAMEPKATLFL